MSARKPSRRDRIRARLADLKMPGALEALDPILSGVDGGNITPGEAIEKLLGAQIELRNARRLQAAMRSSRLPAVKTLADFDFSFQPSIRREQIESLHELGFLERKENVIFLGLPGVGKTHLAISLAIATAQRGRRVYYGTLADLITSLEEAEAAGRVQHRLKVLTHPAQPLALAAPVPGYTVRDPVGPGAAVLQPRFPLLPIPLLPLEGRPSADPHLPGDRLRPFPRQQPLDQQGSTGGRQLRILMDVHRSLRWVG